MEAVFHIDINSAYLSWTAVERMLNQNDEIDLWGILSIIVGDQESRHGIVPAKSMLAKKLSGLANSTTAKENKGMEIHDSAI